ncbi:MAG: hypothetical protein LUC21_05705 [Oscillospiraceae bacterium]|nr:hypothetical protein [Oscillospiraceae bacterium]
MLERDFQAKLIRELKVIFPGCVILKNDPNYKQGVPDLLILYRDKWAALECKKSETASRQANQIASEITSFGFMILRAGKSPRTWSSLKFMLIVTASYESAQRRKKTDRAKALLRRGHFPHCFVCSR